MKTRPVTWNGIEYPSVNAAARANGFTGSQMRYYINARNYEGDDDICNWKNYYILHLSSGTYYESVQEAAEQTGVTRLTVYRHINGGRKKQKYKAVPRREMPDNAKITRTKTQDYFIWVK